MKCVVDAHSWIDYFDGNEKGKKAKEYIESDANEIVTHILDLAEISSFFARKNAEKGRIDEAFQILFSISKIYYLNPEFSREAGILHAEIRKRVKDFGLIDAFILLTARKLNAKIITGDMHFKGMKDVILIE